MSRLRYLPIDDALYRYVLEHTLREHPEQTALREATRQLPHAGMQIAPEQGQFMAAAGAADRRAPRHRDRRVHRLQRPQRGADAA